MRRLLERLADWICARIGLTITFDGNLMAPTGDESWWPAPAISQRELQARALATCLLDDGGDGWPVQDIYALLEADGWTWNGAHWVEVDTAIRPIMPSLFEVT